MNELQVIISNPTEETGLKRIEWNRDEFKAEVVRLLENYQNVVYTDDQVDIMKKDRATLNAAKKAISDRRIEVKKTIMAPYDQFEAEVKEIVSDIEEVISTIDGQVKRIESDRKQKKREKLEKIYQEIAADLGPDVSFERVFDPKWLNATVGLSKAENELRGAVDVIRFNLGVIDEMEEEDRISAKSAYLRTLDMPKAMAEMTRQRAIREEEKHRREEQKIQVEKPVEEVTKEADVLPAEPEMIETPPAPETPVVKSDDDKIVFASFTVYGTKSKLLALKQYMIDNGLRIEKAQRITKEGAA